MPAPHDTTVLAPGLSAFHNVVALDGRFTPYPSDLRAFAPLNQYLLTAGDGALLLDTGMTVHEQRLLQQVAASLGETRRLSVFPLRFGEFDSVCNVRSLHDRFGLDVLYGAQRDGLGWMDFRPDQNAFGQETGGRTLEDVRFEYVGANGSIPVGGDRVPLEAVRPMLRLLPTHWLHDPETRTLFTSDSFSHCVRASADGPWTVTAATDGTEPADLREHLLSSRYWWLAGAAVDPLRRELEALFERVPIERIAPGYGCVIDGAEAVQRHYDMLQEALLSVGRAEAPAPSTAGGRR